MTSNLPATNGSGQMFDRIAEKYDLLNRLISFGLDISWRKKLLKAINVDGTSQLLDVATGTADVAIDAVRTFPGLQATGLDPSVGMLGVGQRKINDAGLQDAITLVEGDALAMPFEDDRFHASCVSFGIRNFPDRLQGLREMTRCIKPGGRVVVLELSEPRKGFTAPFARLHIHRIVPFVGSLLSGDKEYAYLAKSIAAFPAPDDFAALMREAGLQDVRYEPMTFGVAHLYVGTKPEA